MALSLTGGKAGLPKKIRDPWMLLPLGGIVLGLGALTAYWLWPQRIPPRFTMTLLHRDVLYGDHLRSIKDLGVLMGIKVVREG